MRKKNDLFEALGMEKKEPNVYALPRIDIPAIKQKVSAKLDSASTERKFIIMKSKKKLSLIVAAAALALGITAFAASGIITTRFSASSSKPDYASLPTAQQVTKDIGYTPILIDTFQNGYAFQSGSIVNNRLADENGKTVEKFKSVSFDYEKDGDTVIFAQDQFRSGKTLQGDIIKTVNGADIYYYSYTGKSVPEDYTLTETDKKAEASGELVFSYGSSDVQIQNIQSVTWVIDDMQYQLLQIDGKLSKDALSDMAQEVINR